MCDDAIIFDQIKMILESLRSLTLKNLAGTILVASGKLPFKDQECNAIRTNRTKHTHMGSSTCINLIFPRSSSCNSSKCRFIGTPY